MSVDRRDGQEVVMTGGRRVPAAEVRDARTRVFKAPASA
jgi:hypothetical protein